MLIPFLILRLHWWLPVSPYAPHIDKDGVSLAYASSNSSERGCKQSQEIEKNKAYDSTFEHTNGFIYYCKQCK